jgi:hypothetical protein
MTSNTMSDRRFRGDIGITAPVLSRPVDLARSKQPDKQPLTGTANLVELSRALPEQIHAAAQAISLAEQRLAEVLTLRATGQAVKRSQIATARIALDKARRDAEDLQRIQSVVRAALERTREPPKTESIPRIG